MRKHFHGLTDHELFRMWRGMRSRCNTKSDGQYRYYGGRGIKVCERWDDFALFLTDVGERPAGMTLERLDVNGDYTPENCVWASWTDQMHNQSISRRNKSGYTGVHWDKSRGRWLVSLAVKRKSIFVGRYDDKQEAIEARQEAEKRYW